MRILFISWEFIRMVQAVKLSSSMIHFPACIIAAKHSI
jgi:hypothetical protein